MINPIFFAGPAELAPLAAGSVFVLGGPEGRHAVTVKRLGPGEVLDLVDGAGRRVTGIVTVAGAGELSVRVERVSTEPAPAVRLILAQALAKGDRDELAIETATELGADGFIPWQSERSIVRWKGERAAKSLAKWRSTVRAAAKQARRAWIPDVCGAVETAGLLKRVETASLALVLHEGAADPLSGTVGRLRARTGGSARAGIDIDTAGIDTVGNDMPASGTAGNDPGLDDAAANDEILIIVGPEGGISGRELDLLTGAGAVPVRLGPHVLRSSTAGPAAVALLSVELGRW
ncbi:16S rRNA (uracil(1498)-N(3))-methyltransferase [Arthrobacter sp. A5]|uniref:16S rRNA (uracil(1498)-N(3))-methyltransferase n=1 Tax=Arthrobacter sp. A5 TaxID=576926 RepID=UPI003DA98507